MFSLDTNILVYAADKEAGAKHVAASDIVHAASRVDAALTEQSIIEFVNAVTRKAKLSLSSTLPYVGEFQRNFDLLLPTESVVDDVLALLTQHKINIFDARIVAVCAAHGCDHLLSEDLHDGAQYGGVTVVNPFNPGNAGLIGRLLS